MPLHVGGFVHTKCIVAQGTKDIKVNGLRAPTSGEVVVAFQDANQVVKSFFVGPNFEGAVVVVPNSTSSSNRDAVTAAARAEGFNVIEVINEQAAVAAAYVEIVKPTSNKRLAIVSVINGVLDVSVVTVKPDLEFVVEAHETHLEPIEFEEQKKQESKHSGPGGLIGIVGGVVGGVVKTLVVDPLDMVFDILLKLLSSPKLGKSPVDELVLIGKAFRSEKLKEVLKKKFPNARVWSPNDFGADEVVAYGAGVLAFKQKPADPSIETPPAKQPVDYEESDSGKGNVNVVEEKHGEEGGEEEKHGEEGGEEKTDQSSKKFVPISSVIF
ncbi:probable mediator of RNA polymerase II transcription subunit 37b isoform X2 [Dendrobium catenatum]|uniref:probable mediator of RNA polymerase II transcription subunit 37b isoform X2 n=1 Tax=Dendrobium catenatum TaxID=906689 RepID=UPI0009F342D1|nr:probable mediator of RNA polymerase II transcription subunit 37b isoform X2 [Dendrobium catenatum]